MKLGGEQNIERILKAQKAVQRFIGSSGQAFRNEAGDLVVLSSDEMREVRFDFKRTFPHRHPHMHIVEYEWVKNNKRRLAEERIWPCDLPNE